MILEEYSLKHSEKGSSGSKCKPYEQFDSSKKIS